MRAEGAAQLISFLETVFLGRKEKAADLTEELPFGTVVTVDVVGGCIAAGTSGICRYHTAFSAAHRSQDLPVVSSLVFTSQMFPILVWNGNDLREFIRLELLIFRGVRIIESPLPERYIPAEQAEKHTILLIKLLAKRK